MPALRNARHALIIAALVIPTLARPALAQTYPAQSITFVVAFAAGGIADVVGRLVGQKLSEKIKQSVIVENRGGAGGNLACQYRRPARGRRLHAARHHLGVAVNMTAPRKTEASRQNDLRPVAFVAISPDVIAIHPSNPAKNLKEFIANAKENSFTYGSAGAGTGPQIGAEYFFKEVAKVQYVHVPFQGGAPAITAALGNHVDALVLTLPPVTPQSVRGALRGLGVAADKRNNAIPDVPTYGEMGYPNIIRFVGRVFRSCQNARRDGREAQCRDNAVMKEPDFWRGSSQGRLRSMSKTSPRGKAYFKSEVEAGARWSGRSASRSTDPARAERPAQLTKTRAPCRISDTHGARLNCRRTPRPAAPPRGSGKGRRAIRGGDHAGDGGADRSRRPARSDRAAVRARSGRARPATRRSSADPIGDDAHSPVEGIVHRYPDRVLLKLTHVCAVYCRFCFRREMVGPGRRSR